MFAARRAMAAGAIPPPTYTSVSPASGKSGDTVTITGTNFVSGNTTIKFGTTDATSVNVTSSTSLTCVVPSLGTSNATSAITITTPSGSVTTGTQFDGTNRRIWANTTNVASDTPGAAVHNVTSSAIQVAKTYNTEYLQGDVAVAMIYNRALSSAEIQQNFNFYRSRFGL